MNEAQVPQLPKNLESRIRRTDACWLWTGRLDKGGYGRLTTRKGTQVAHRLTYQVLVGPIPDGLELDHLCRVRNCVNPAHLEPVTRAENAQRSAPAQKTECINGHAYTPENTHIRLPGERGRRVCRACKRESSRRRYALRKKGEAR